MKTLRTILIVLLVILVLLIAGLQVFLTRGLSTALNDVVFPAVKTISGLEMSITDASVNLLKGRAGAVYEMIGVNSSAGKNAPADIVQQVGIVRELGLTGFALFTWNSMTEEYIQALEACLEER